MTSTERPKTAAEATARLHSVFDDIQSIVGGTWHVEDDSPPAPCTIAGGGDGVSSKTFRYTQEPVDRKAAFAQVKEKWQKDGYALTEREETDAAPMLRLFATTPDGQELQFSAADISMTLEGRSACAPDTGEK